jgi:hypothetical protein
MYTTQGIGEGKPVELQSEEAPFQLARKVEERK